MCVSDGGRLQGCNGDDAVQHTGQQLLAAGGGHLPAQPSGCHSLDGEKLLWHLPVYRLG